MDLFCKPTLQMVLLVFTVLQCSPHPPSSTRPNDSRYVINVHRRWGTLITKSQFWISDEAIEESEHHGGQSSIWRAWRTQSNASVLVSASLSSKHIHRQIHQPNLPHNPPTLQIKFPQVSLWLTPRSLLLMIESDIQLSNPFYFQRPSSFLFSLLSSAHNPILFLHGSRSKNCHLCTHTDQNHYARSIWNIISRQRTILTFSTDVRI